MKSLKTMFVFAAVWVAFVAAAQPKVVAHRGLWKVPGSAQNSIAALEKADSAGIWGVEFDVWLTADNSMVVNHDSTFRGVTPEKATEAVCRAVVLSNGENMPTLEQYLKRAEDTSVRLIFELKPHSSAERDSLAAEMAVAAVAAHGLQQRTDYITFSREALRHLVRLAPSQAEVYYLGSDIDPAKLKELGVAGADYNIGVMRAHPDWFDQCHKLGLKVNVWTVDDPEDIRWVIEQGADFITTNVPLDGAL